MIWSGLEWSHFRQREMADAEVIIVSSHELPQLIARSC